MGKFYTSVEPYGNAILHRGVEDGKRFSERVSFRPTLYVPSNKKTEFVTLDNKYAEEIEFDSMKDSREFISNYSGTTGFQIYGAMDAQYQFIGKEYSGELDYEYSDLTIAYIDIETECENGFPNIETADQKINAITIRVGDERYVYALGEVTIDDDNVHCFCFDEEDMLIGSFIEKWRELDPDIVTGWNVKFFDMPYIIHRTNRIIGEEVSKLLSPWKIVRQKTIETQRGTQTAYDIRGVATLDYYDLYKKFTFQNQASYRLDHIAFVELGERKMSYEEFDNMAEFYKKDFQKFIEYNIKDVDLVFRLEEKMRLIELAVAIAYTAKVNFSDVFSQVKTWDCIIYHYLREHNVVIPPKKFHSKDTQYAGAYVKDPIIGMHDWVVSFDLNSLYPHLIMQYNISPETKVTNNKDHTITPNSVLGGKSVQHDGYSVAANGTCYRKDHQGFLPALMEKLYKERSMYKKKMIDCEKRKEAGEKNLDNQIAKFRNFQLVRKVQLNSAYGAIGNQYFRYFDVDMAEAITLSGQLSIRWIEEKLNEFLNNTIGTEDYDYVIASDTDSVYLRCGNLVDKVCGGKSKSEVVEFLDKASREIILPEIKKQYDILARMMNAYENKMVMDRECIADKGIWTAKKRYMLNVHDSEGVRYDTPKMKIMGIETTRSSTPQVVRDALRKSINLIMSSDESTVIEFIENFRDEFNTLDAEDIAFPRSVNGMDRYRCPSQIFKKGTPIAVKGALIFNHTIKEHNLTRRYKQIKDGEKIKFIYLKVPNPCGERVVSFSSSLPKEFDLTRFVDYNMQFGKSFLDPLKNILDTIGWDTEKRNTLEDLFV